MIQRNDDVQNPLTKLISVLHNTHHKVGGLFLTLFKNYCLFYYVIHTLNPTSSSDVELNHS